MKSYAKRLLETTLREDDAAPGKALLSDPTPGPGALPTATGGSPAGDQPHEEPGSLELQKLAEEMPDPDTMSTHIDKCCDLTDKYLDEEDDSVFTPADQEQKSKIEEARSKMREAASCMRGMKK